MPHFGWTRLAYLLFVLVVLTALVQLASLGTDPRPLASEPRDGGAAEAPQTSSEEPREPARQPREPAKTAQPASAAPPAALPVSVADSLEDMATDVPGGGSPYTRHTRVPVFERPAPPPVGSEVAAVRAPAYSSEPVCGNLEKFPSSSRILFPLPKAYFDSYEDTWGAPRPQGGHEGTDLMVPTGTPEYALTDGTVVPVAGANRNGWNSLGGYAVMVEAAYSVGPIKKGDLFYYAHLERESALKIGTRVRAGQVVGYAGDTGQGPEVTRGLFPPHLHLGWYNATGSRSDVVSGAMNPYPLLEWIKANGGAITGGSDVRYCRAPQTGAPTPSAGAGRWPEPDLPGVRPDLDTGSQDPRPSPVIEESHHRAGHPVEVGKKAKPAGQRDKPATQSGRGTNDDPAAAAKEPPKPKPSHPEPAALDTTPAESPVLPDQRPQPPGAGSPNESRPSKTAEGKKHGPSEEKQGAETGENKEQEAEEQNQEEIPQKDPEHDSRPPGEHTSPEEDPQASETTEPQTAGEAETDPESTVPESTEITTETTVEVTTTE
jgi:murein DD-endopeptidase MepM/ murein hydrolase activator NlpD